MAPNVDFLRDIHKGTTGPDVVAHKRAISRARPDLYPWHDFSPYAGDYFMTAVSKWKKSKGLGSLPKIGAHAHEVLERTHSKNHPKEWAFDALAVKIANDFYEQKTTTPEERIREAIVTAASFFYAHRWAISYSQYRPFQMGKPPYVPSREDCSGFFTLCHYAGGAPDPNGRGYDHLGYTGTLQAHGVRVTSIEQLSPGDAIFYGYSYPKPGFYRGAPTHVALYAGLLNGTHMIYSMGSYPMKFVPYNYRRDLNHFRHYHIS